MDTQAEDPIRGLPVLAFPCSDFVHVFPEIFSREFEPAAKHSAAAFLAARCGASRKVSALSPSGHPEENSLVTFRVVSLCHPASLFWQVEACVRLALSESVSVALVAVTAVLGLRRDFRLPGRSRPPKAIWSLTRVEFPHAIQISTRKRESRPVFFSDVRPYDQDSRVVLFSGRNLMSSMSVSAIPVLCPNPETGMGVLTTVSSYSGG